MWQSQERSTLEEDVQKLRKTHVLSHVANRVPHNLGQLNWSENLIITYHVHSIPNIGPSERIQIVCIKESLIP